MNESINDNQNNDGENIETKKKLTDSQLRILQVVLGIVSAIALVVSMYVPSMMVQNKQLDEGSLLTYLFVAVFLVIMVGRRTIENKYRLRLNLYSLVLINGIVCGVIMYMVLIMFDPKSGSLFALDLIWKVLILVGLVLLVLILGVIIPYLRYKKRVANGTVQPIRIPEKPMPAEVAEGEIADDGPMTIEQKIAAMTRELDNPSEKKPEDSNSNKTE